MAAVYVPRSPTTGVLYGVVRTHLTDFLAAVDAQTDGSGLPGFVVNEFRKFLRCGVLAHGFARVRCGHRAFERLVPFSCKGRAVCPSCGGRRMAERAAHLVDRVLPADVPVRQWVLSVPHRLRYRLAYDHRLCRTVLHVSVRALRSAYRRQARRQGLAGGETGMATSVQRFGGAVNVHLHFHTLVLDGVFVRDGDGTLRFRQASPPTDEDVHRVVARVRRRLERLGVTGTASAAEDPDPLADESAALAALSRAAILGRGALGPRAGRRPVRIGADPDAPWVERHVPLHAHEAGFDLHAAVHVAAGDRERLERLCQYLLPSAARAGAPAPAARRADRRRPAAPMGRRDDPSRLHTGGAAGAARPAGAPAADQPDTLSRRPGAERAVAPGGGGARRTRGWHGPIAAARRRPA